MAKKKQILYPVLFMLVITIAFVTTLAVINSATKDTIAKQEALNIKENILYVLNIKHETTEASIEQAYGKHVTEKDVKSKKIYYANAGKNGYAFAMSGAGLWGSMKGFAAVSSDLKTLKGISFVSHSETPGLGGRIDEAWFKEQFRKLPIKERNTVVYRPSQDGNIDAITGATLTSESVRKIVNREIADFISVIGGDL